ncbi:MAG: SpoIIE family protein phosphatase [Bacteroidetes bacterium]|nr:SpoIIE family protein phosphatase [Bacteroidota bacterium]
MRHINPPYFPLCFRYFTLFLFFCPSVSSAQDSLEAKLQTTEGIERVQILSQLAQKNLYSDTEKSIAWSKEAAELAGQLNDENGKVKALLILGNGHEIARNFPEAISCYEKVRVVYESWGEDEGKAYIYNRLGRGNFFAGQHEKAEFYFNKALTLYKNLNDPVGKISIYEGLGDLRQVQRNMEAAIRYFQSALDEAGKSNNMRAKATALAKIGIAYSDGKNFEKAFDYLNLALPLAAGQNLTDLKDKIEKNIEIIRHNMGVQQKHDQLEKQIEQKHEEAMKEIEKKYELQQVKSLEEIEKLSKENQLKELKIRIQQDDFNRKIIEKKHELVRKEHEADRKRMYAELKQRKLDVEQKEGDLREADLEKQKMLKNSFLAGIGLLLVIVFLGIIAYMLKRRSHRQLEQKNKIISEQKDQIEKKNQTIISSIEYAKRIQQTILTPDDDLKKFFPESFILYKPRDIVSGDFYHLVSLPIYHSSVSTSPPTPPGPLPPLLDKERGSGGEVILTVADCTGHGVPGAFMSLLGYNMLKEVIKKNDSGKPADILDTLNQYVCELMLKQSEGDLSRYGMDLSVVSFDFRKKEVQFAGAHHLLFIVRNGELKELRGNHSIVGMRHEEKPHYFTNHTELFQPGDMLYLFTDGFADQLGGDEKRKYYRENLKKLFTGISTLPPDEQKQKLEEAHLNWKGDLPQTDDILMIGVRV